MQLMNSLHSVAQFPILFLLGAALLAGTLGARLFQRLHIPQVVGYIAIGVLIGRSGFELFDQQRLQALMPLNFLALGVIGFVIGSELSVDVFRKHGKQFIAILLCEAFAAFVMVSALVGGIVYWLTGSGAEAFAFGSLLGAIASATAPAATVDVLWEYRTKGILTTTILAIVALDDAFALLLYSLATSLTTILLGGTGAEGGIWSGLWHNAYELGFAIVLGTAAGYVLNRLLRSTHERDKFLTFIVGMLAIVLGLAMVLKVDVILAAMSLGMTLVNLAPRRSREALAVLEPFTPPIYVLFFVVVGARLSVDSMPWWMWGVAGAYVAGRTSGKMLGAWFGARWAQAAASVRRYLGLCLFSQAGVAIGLSLLASIRFADIDFNGVALGDAVVMIVTATTFLVQVIGPPCVKYSVTRAGEVGLDVTEESLVASYRVQDAMDTDAPTFAPQATVATILSTAADSDAMNYPVVNGDGRVLGMITMDSLKRCFAGDGVQDWLVAFDLMEQASEPARPELPLSDVIERMKDEGLECLSVVSNNGMFAGLLEQQQVRRMISRELLRRKQLAEGQLQT